MSQWRARLLPSFVKDKSDPTDKYVAAQFVAFLAAYMLRIWSIALPAMALFAGLAWIAAQRRARAIDSTPTSRIASAAQGYVELTGRAEAHEGLVLSTPIRARPCLWYRYTIEEKKGDDWREIERGSSDTAFALRDESGVCVVDPRRAMVHTLHKERWREGSRRYLEESLWEKDALYVLGGFSSHNPAERVLDVKQALNTTLTEWKRDQDSLRERFDANRDGAIDQDEWRYARLAALKQIHAEHAQARALPVTHNVHAPRDGRVYLISNTTQDNVARRASTSAFLHMVWFAVTIIIALLYLTQADKPLEIFQ